MIVERFKVDESIGRVKVGKALKKEYKLIIRKVLNIGWRPFWARFFYSDRHLRQLKKDYYNDLCAADKLPYVNHVMEPVEELGFTSLYLTDYLFRKVILYSVWLYNW